MGVSGCGKSSVGLQLAGALDVPFLEGDTYHSYANVAKMTAGVPLTDSDRADWLQALHQQIRDARLKDSGLVLSCSSLKRRYRDLLRSADPALRFAHLAGPRELIASRMAARKDHYMPTTLLDSQLAALEPLQEDEAGIVLDIGKPPAELVQQILHI
ncbi:gluconokinase [Duganella dendranthematis]|jgi:carbohydrate kinase (thermoresistant glucokinase family)|uniref:Gluconokinase n=2 Tax=Duganella dendranthematis TaxID=2728021 RepID=A0ABX6MJ11_9BURK|nr:gluconokinase [Duganella dendranthematis]